MILESNQFELKVSKTCNSQNPHQNLIKQDNQLLIDFLSKKSFCPLNMIPKLQWQHLYELLIQFAFRI